VSLVAVCCPDRGLMLVVFMITTPSAARLKSAGEDPFVVAGSAGSCAQGGLRLPKAFCGAGMPVAWRSRRRTSVSSRWATWEAAASP
jgi:hypothetical protein